MTGKEMRRVWSILDNEGVDYGLIDYTDFRLEVQDDKFHELRDKYVAARAELLEYVGYEDDNK